MNTNLRSNGVVACTRVGAFDEPHAVRRRAVGRAWHRRNGARPNEPSGAGNQTIHAANASYTVTRRTGKANPRPEFVEQHQHRMRNGNAGEDYPSLEFGAGQLPVDDGSALKSRRALSMSATRLA